ncbi:MAG: hypothetical protein ACRD19_10245, partial [Terriglobia bacterium]
SFAFKTLRFLFPINTKLPQSFKNKTLRFKAAVAAASGRRSLIIKTGGEDAAATAHDPQGRLRCRYAARVLPSDAKKT